MIGKTLLSDQNHLYFSTWRYNVKSGEIRQTGHVNHIILPEINFEKISLIVDHKLIF